VCRVTRRTTVQLVSMAAVALLAVTACGGAARPATSAPKFHLVAPGVLTVATHGSTPPEIIVEPDGKLSGMNGVWINAVARAHGLRIKAYQTTFPSMILAVEQGKADVGTGVFYTAERAKQIYYTHPFYTTRAAMITLRSFPYRGPDSLKGRKVGTVLGYVWVPYLQQTFGAQNVELFQDEASVGQALLNGQIQGYVNGADSVLSPPLASHLSEVVAHDIKPGQFGMPNSVLVNVAYNIVECNNPGLAAAMNQTLVTLHRDGTWSRALKEYKLNESFDAKPQRVQQLCHA
jgi:ABC-type amino acid transport substrate-binding protein